MQRYIWILILLGLSAIVAADDSWLTTYEKSGFTETARYAETIDYCRKLDDASPVVQYRAFGISPEGRELPLLIVNEELRDAPLFLIIAGIHSGEIDGKDAGLTLLRDALIEKKYPNLLENIRIAFVPIFDVDGHERFSAWSRPNQFGPKEAGWRTTAQNLNLNRDWLKADAPEMRAMLNLIADLQPDFLADIHVTDGADHQYAITYGFGVYENELPSIRHYSADVFLPAVKRRMDSSGLEFVPYSSFRRGYDVRSGVQLETYEPRFSNGYGTVINRPFILIETHSLKDYHTRVTATYEFLKAAIETISTQREPLRATVRVADSLATNLAGSTYALEWKLKPDSSMTAFQGVDYRFVPSKITGDSVVRWGKERHSYRIPVFDKHIPTDTVTVPFAYVIPRAWVPLVEDVLLAHNLQFVTTSNPATALVETYRFSNVRFSPRPYEGRFRTEFETTSVQDTLALPAGSIIVALDQPRSQVAVHLLEPKGPDSFVRWGFFPQIFEQKEYIESYVLDTLATRMLAESPVLAQEFNTRLNSDSAFAASPSARFQFFYERSPYWDARKDLYPIGRITSREELDRLKLLNTATSK